MLRAFQHAFVRPCRRCIQRTIRSAHKQLLGTGRIDQCFDIDLAAVFPIAAHPACDRAQRDGAMIAQFRAVPCAQCCVQLCLVSVGQFFARQHLRPQVAHCGNRRVHIGYIVLHAVQLPVHSQRQLHRFGGGYTGRAQLIAHRTAK